MHRYRLGNTAANPGVLCGCMDAAKHTSTKQNQEQHHAYTSTVLRQVFYRMAPMMTILVCSNHSFEARIKHRRLFLPEQPPFERRGPNILCVWQAGYVA